MIPSYVDFLAGLGTGMQGFIKRELFSWLCGFRKRCREISTQDGWELKEAVYHHSSGLNAESVGEERLVHVSALVTVVLASSTEKPELGCCWGMGGWQCSKWDRCGGG